MPTMEKNVSEMSVRELREELQSLGIDISGCIEKGDFVEKLTVAREESIKRTSGAVGEIHFHFSRLNDFFLRTIQTILPSSSLNFALASAVIHRRSKCNGRRKSLPCICNQYSGNSSYRSKR
jgi:hypothetical protein